jgi:hypothetical protein
MGRLMDDRLGLHSLDPLQPLLQQDATAEQQDEGRIRQREAGQEEEDGEHVVAYIAVEVDIEDEHAVLTAEGVQLELQREFEGLQREWIKGRQAYDGIDSVAVRADRELFAVLRQGRLLKGGVRYYAPRTNVNAIFAAQTLGLLVRADSPLLVKAFRGWASGTK